MSTVLRVSGRNGVTKRIKADLQTDTLSTIRAKVVAEFALEISEEGVLLCAENSSIINLAFAAVTPGDIKSSQDATLADLGLKRGSFVYAAWADPGDDLPRLPTTGPPAPAPAPPAGAAADPVAFGLQPAKKITGAATFDSIAANLSRRGVVLVHIVLPSGRRLMDQEASADLTVGDLAGIVAQRFGDELRVTAGPEAGDVGGDALAAQLRLFDDGEWGVVQGQLPSARTPTEIRAVYSSACARFGALDAELANDPRGPGLEEQRHAATRIHVAVVPAEAPADEVGVGESKVGPGGAAGGTVVRGSTGPLVQEWHGESFDKAKDVLKPFSVKDTAVKNISVNTDPFFNQTLVTRRVAWLFGTVSGQGEVRVEGWYEPPQYGFTNRFLLLPDPHSDAVKAVAARLGWELVGWCFTCPFRAAEEPLTGPEVMKIASLQGDIPHFTTLVFQSERLPEELVRKHAGTRDADGGAQEGKVAGTTHAGRTVTVQSMQAYQLQSQVLALAKAGKLHYRADRPEETNGSAYILWCDEAKMGVNPDTDNYGPTHKIHVSYAAAPVAIIGLGPQDTQFPPPWFPAPNRYDQHGSPLTITPALYKHGALQEFLAAQGKISALGVMGDFNFLVHAAVNSIAAYGQGAWDSCVAALPAPGQEGGFVDQETLRQTFRENKSAGVPEAWFTPEEVLHMALFAGRGRNLRDRAELLTPKLWRLLGLGWRCPHCMAKGQLNKFDEVKQLVAHLKRVHTDTGGAVVVNPLPAAYAKRSGEREQYSTALEGDMRRHHLASRVGITDGDGSDDDTAAYGRHQFDGPDVWRSGMGGGGRIGGRGTDILHGLGALGGPSRAEREAADMRRVMEASMRDAGLDDETIALRLAEHDGDGGVSASAVPAPAATPDTTVGAVAAGLAGALDFMGDTVGQAGASLYSSGMAGLQAAMGSGGDEPEDPVPRPGMRKTRSSAARTAAAQAAAMDRLTRGSSTAPAPGGGGHIRRGGARQAPAPALAPTPAPAPAPPATAGGGSLHRPPGMTDAEWEDVQLAHVIALSTAMDGGGKSGDEDEDGYVMVPPQSGGFPHN